jgi:hypothetical protein
VALLSPRRWSPSTSLPTLSTGDASRIDASKDDNAVTPGDAPYAKVSVYEFADAHQVDDSHQPRDLNTGASAVEHDGSQETANDVGPNDGVLDPASADGGGAAVQSQPHGRRRSRLPSMQSGPPSVFHSTVSRHPSWENHRNVINDPPAPAASVPPNVPPPQLPSSAWHPSPLQQIADLPSAVAEGAIPALCSIAPVVDSMPIFHTFHTSPSRRQHCGAVSGNTSALHDTSGEAGEFLERLPPPSPPVAHAFRSSAGYRYDVPPSPITHRYDVNGGPFVAAHPYAGSTDDCSSPLGSIYKFGRRRRSSFGSPSRHAVVHVAGTPDGGSLEHGATQDDSEELI